MQTFEKLSDLEHLSPNDRAGGVIHEILERLSRLTEQEGRPYRAEIDGYVCLAGPEDLDRTFDEVLPGYTLETAPWEAVHMHSDIWVAAFVPNNSSCTLVLIPNEDWLPDSLRRVLCANLVPNVT
jgi:hypothetical protein